MKSPRILARLPVSQFSAAIPEPEVGAPLVNALALLGLRRGRRGLRQLSAAVAEGRGGGVRDKWQQENGRAKRRPGFGRESLLPATLNTHRPARSRLPPPQGGSRLPHSVLPLAVASLLITSSLFAVTDTWDGGGADPFISTDNNWIDNTAPASDLVNSDLIFAGTTGLTPTVGLPFSARSITFNNTAGAFTIQGTDLDVGAGGITNNDSQTMTFTGRVNFNGVVTAPITANSGRLSFADFVTLPAGSLNVNGNGATSFTDFLGPGTLTKSGAGVMTWTTNGTASFNVVINAGTLRMGPDGDDDVFDGASIAVNGAGIFDLDESVILEATQLTRSSTGTISLAAGKTLAVQDGGDVTITGAFANTTASTITVTGAGSTLSTTANLTLGGGSVTNVSAGASISSGTGSISVGTSGDGTVTVTGSGSSLSGGTLNVGLNGNEASVTFSSGSTGSFGAIKVDDDGLATIGVLRVDTGAAVTGTNLSIADGPNTNTGTVTINGAGSTLTINDANTATIGAATASQGRLNVQAGGTFHSGTGLTKVNALGTIALTGGTYNSHGNLTLSGGKLTRDLAGVLALDAGTIFTIQGDGDAIIAGAFTNSTSSRINVTGAGSTFTTTSTVTFNNDGIMVVSAGGSVSSGTGSIMIWSGAVSVDGIGTSANGGNLSIGHIVGHSSFTFTNGSTGTFGSIGVSDIGSGGVTGTLNIQSGAGVTGTGLFVSPLPSLASTGTATIDGAGSALTLTGAAPATIGSASGGTGTLNVQDSGTFNSGTGLMTVHATGTVAITDGTFNADGNLTLNGGKLTRDATGIFALAAGKTLKVQAGGDAIFTGDYSHTTASSIVVTGAGSTLSTTGSLALGAGSTTSVLAGASISSGTELLGLVNDAAATVDGSGSSLSAGNVFVGLGTSARLTFSNGSTGAISGALAVEGAATAGTDGELNIESGATVTAGSLTVANNVLAHGGTVLITGSGSALTLSGVATIGATSASTATLNVENGGTFTTGTGLTTVNVTGDLNVNAGGTMIVRGDMVVANSLDIANGGTVILGGGAPAPGEFAEPDLTGPDEFDSGAVENIGGSSTVDFAAVPEPGSATLITAGALSLLARRRRR